MPYIPPIVPRHNADLPANKLRPFQKLWIILFRTPTTRRKPYSMVHAQGVAKVNFPDPAPWRAKGLMSGRIGVRFRDFTENLRL